MIMDSQTILAMWAAVQDRFSHMVKALDDEQLQLAIGPATIGYMIRHSAEVEYVYAQWVFGKPKPEGIEYMTLRGPGQYNGELDQLQPLIALLQHSNETISRAIHDLPAEQWNEEVHTPRGTFTRLDAIAQLIYHTGIHAGQIALIQKQS